MGHAIWNVILDNLMKMDCDTTALIHGLKESFAQVIGEETNQQSQVSWLANNHRWADLLKRFERRVTQIHKDFVSTMEEVAEDIQTPYNSEPGDLLGSDVVIQNCFKRLQKYPQMPKNALTPEA